MAEDELRGERTAGQWGAIRASKLEQSVHTTPFSALVPVSVVPSLLFVWDLDGSSCFIQPQPTAGINPPMRKF